MSLYHLGKINLAYFTNGKGVNIYRAIQPLESLRNKNYDILRLPDIAEYTPSESQMDDFIHTYPNLDIIFMSVPQPSTCEFVSSMKAIDSFSTFKNGTNKRPLWIFDWDDDYFDVHPLNRAYKYWGTSKVAFKLKDGSLIYPHKDIDIGKNKTRLNQLHSLMMAADGIFTTTNRLADKHATHTISRDKVHVLPNAVDLKEYDYTKKKVYTDGKCRFVWMVSDSHINDWIVYRPILGRFFKEHPDCEMHLFGAHFGIERDIPRSQFFYHPYIGNRKEYIQHFCDIGADFSLAPLIENSFNWCKSPLKWIEASALKIPSILGNVVFSDFVSDGDKCYMADGLDYYDKMCEAYSDWKNNKIKVDKVAVDAYNHIRETYSLEVISGLYDNTFRKILGESLRSGGGIV